MVTYDETTSASHQYEFRFWYFNDHRVQNIASNESTAGEELWLPHIYMEPILGEVQNFRGNRRGSTSC
jgi:hypothetical protein